MGDERGTTSDPTVQRHRLLRDQALLQRPRQPRPRLRPAMQPPPQAVVAAAGMPPQQVQGSGGLASAAAAQAKAGEAARARVAEQMAFEDAFKALNPDFRTPFASVEDAVSRLLPYHVFADYEEDDDIGDGSSSIATATENSSAQNWEDDMGAQVEGFVEDFEKQVLTFNIMTHQQHAAGFNRGEEQLMLERALYDDERLQAERLRTAIVQHQQQEQQEAARARLALVQAQAAAGGWQAAQPAASWQALAAVARGEGASSGHALAPAVVMQQPQQETMVTVGVWQALAAAASRGDGGSNEQALIQAVMMRHMQRYRQQQEEMMVAAASRGEGASTGQALPPAAVAQLMQQHNQQRQQEEMMMQQLRLLQQQQHQREVMAAGGWQLVGQQTFAAPRGDGSSSSQAALPPAMLQQPGQGQGQGQTSTAGMALALPWRGTPEDRSSSDAGAL